MPDINPQMIEDKRSAVRASVTIGTTLSVSYLAMNVAAALIAGLGLMENSPATIIGAMLIAMLYGPIIGIGLGLAEADLHLLGRALWTEFFGALFVLASGFLIGLASRDIVIGSEILGRTSPTMVDLLVALVGGLAGGFTFISRGLSGVVVGVAIATSLVPPLTTCGILLARNSPSIAGGAFLLFLANFAAIALGAMVTFLLAGHRPKPTDKIKKVLLPRLMCLGMGLLLAFHLNGTLGGPARNWPCRVICAKPSHRESRKFRDRVWLILHLHLEPVSFLCGPLYELRSRSHRSRWLDSTNWRI